MGEIYKKARRVIIWLGAGIDETYVIMNSMAKLRKASDRYAYNDWRVSDKRWEEIWSDMQPILKNEHPNLLARQREGLHLLLRRPWFKRVWILQEVANARAAIVLCGPISVSARIFAFVPSLLGIDPGPHCQAVLDIMPGPSRKHSWWSQKRDLHTLLVKFGTCYATDPRDRIYALLNMSSDACDSNFLRAEYTKSLKEVIQDTTLFLLSLHKLGRTIDSLPDWTLPHFLRVLNSLSNEVLKWAWEKGHKKFARLLVGRDDINVNSKDNDDLTPLCWAVQNRHEKFAKLLLGRDDIDVNSKVNDGLTPIC